MILKRGVKIQLLAFLVITVLGITYTAVNYIGIGRGLFGTSYTTYVDLADSGGAFVNSEVTYRGVTVGRVTSMKLTENGVRLTLNITSGDKISRNTVAVVANRSAVGEEYVDLRPRSTQGPYLSEGKPYTIPRQDTQTPVSTADLLHNVDSLVASVKPGDLQTIVDELDKAFTGSAGDLQSILDSSNKIIDTANANYGSTAALLSNSRTVLTTQEDKSSAIKDFAANLATLTDTVRRADGSLRTDIDSVIPTAAQANQLIDNLGPTLPVLLSNLTVTTQVIDQRLPGLRSLLILYPATLGGGFTTTPGDGTEHFGFVLNVNAPPPCTQGYEKARIRYPQITSNPPAQQGIGCTAPKNSPQVVRGARNAPAPLPGPALPPGATDAAGSPPGGAYGSSSSRTSANSRTSGDSGTSGGSGGSGGSSTSGGTTDAGGSSAAGNGTGIQPYQSDSAETVYVSTYDPVTGTFVGPDGKQHTIGTTGGQQRLLGDSSWKWLLLGPLSK